VVPVTNSEQRALSFFSRGGACCCAFFFASLLIYALTAQRGVGWQDSGEFQYRILAGDYFWISGIARAHPFYIFAARIFAALFPPQDRFFAINLFSGIGMSVALAFLALILWRLTRNVWAIVIACLTLGLAHMVWWMSTTAEVYTWSSACLLAEVYCLLRVIETESVAVGGIGGPSACATLGWWAALAFANGVHASIHNFAFLNWPVYGLFFIVCHLKENRGFVLRRVLACVFLWLFGAAFLVVLFAWEWQSSGSLTETVKSLLFGREFEQVVLGARAVNWHLAAMNFVLAGVSLLNPCWLLTGLGWKGLKGCGAARTCLLGLTLIHAVFWARYFVADQATFVLPTLSLLAIWAGAGASAAAGRCARGLIPLACLIPLCSVGGPLVADRVLKAHEGGVSRSRALPFRDEARYWLLPWKHNERSAEQFVNCLRGILRDGDVLFADNTSAGPILAMREAGAFSENFRLITFFTGESDAELVRLAASGKRFLIVSPVSGYASASLLDGSFHFVREGVVFRAVANAPQGGTSARP